MLTVGDVREAFSGLPDDAPVVMAVHFSDEMLEDIDVSLTAIRAAKGQAIIEVDVSELDPYGDDYDGDEDDDLIED